MGKLLEFPYSPANIRLGRKIFFCTNTLAYFSKVCSGEEKNFFYDTDITGLSYKSLHSGISTVK